MNDHELDLALDAIHQERADLSDLPQLHERAFAVPAEYPPHRGWLPHLDTGGFSMFSALKFVVAGAIVALFGGQLLAGVLQETDDQAAAPAASASAMPVESIEGEAALVFEDVAPGVRRVISDGIRELQWVVPPADGGDEAFVLGALSNIAVGADETVWVIWDDELIQLKDATVQEWHTDTLDNTYYQIAVGPDGRLWLAYDDLVSYGPDGRSVRYESPRWGVIWDLAILPDGDIWVIQSFAAQTVGRYEGDGLDELPDVPPGDLHALEVSHAGDLWLLVSEQVGDDTREVIYRYADGWEPLDLPVAALAETHDLPTAVVSGISVAPNGTLWVSLHDRDDWTCEPDWCAIGPDALARFGSAGWELFSPTTGMPPLDPSSYLAGRYLEAAPDDSVWVQPAGDPTEAGTDCAGLANFDGEAWAFYLEDLCVYAMDVAPDGAVWTLAGPREAWGPEPKLPNEQFRFEGAPAGPVHLYVIDPLR